MPVSIRRAEWLAWVSIAIGVCKVLIPGLGVISSTTPPEHRATSLLSGLFVFAVIVTLVHLVKRGKNWARIILSILFGIGVIALPINVSMEFGVGTLSGILVVLQALIQGIVIVLLFLGESNRWFHEQGSASRGSQNRVSLN